MSEANAIHRPPDNPDIVNPMRATISAGSDISNKEKKNFSTFSISASGSRDV
jgi:hypothetical protein